MPRVMTQVLAASLLLSIFSVTAKEISEIAYELAHKEMSADEWARYVRNVKTKYETWINDNGDGNLKRYLDDKTLELAPGILRGNVKALKSMVYWVALYHEFSEPPPNRLSEGMMAHEKELEELLEDFSWERAAAKIKERKSKYDQAQKKLVQKS
jgi:hypothetical protein